MRKFQHGRRHRTLETPKEETMVAPLKKRSSRDRVRSHRARMRQRGLRPIQIWVPDMQAAAFKREAHRQSLAVARSPHAEADQAFIDAISE